MTTPSPPTDIGPVVDEIHQKTSTTSASEKRRGNVAFGGERVKRAKNGFYFTPALFTETGNAMQINRDEIPARWPRWCACAGNDEALGVANDTLRSASPRGICTTSLKYASHFKTHAQWMVMVNSPTAGVDYHVPFGGERVELRSREQGKPQSNFTRP